MNLLGKKLELIFDKKKKTIIESLNQVDIATIKDLLWLFPLAQEEIPEVEPFSNFEVNQNCHGIGTVINFTKKPNFYARGRGRSLLYNCTAILKDKNSDSTLTLKWFNTYKNQADKLSSLKEFEFFGELQIFKNLLQIVNPKIGPFEDNSIIRYSTVNGISPQKISALIKAIPKEIWEGIESATDNIYRDSINQPFTLKDALQYIHCGKNLNNWSLLDVKRRLAYEDFFIQQIMFQVRKEANLKKKTAIYDHLSTSLISFEKSFPYQLTEDQINCIKDIVNDLQRGYPMARLIQGDVGCGKTTVAFSLLYFSALNNFQSAFMAPTESLAAQHFQNFKMMFPQISSVVLLGSTGLKERKEILNDLKLGRIQTIFGTHSLIQENVLFKNLKAIIIDEQHKFGVEQRTAILSKGENPHTLIMTATPIPRSLRLAQYGDLDLSIIKKFPNKEKKLYTRIVKQGQFVEFLNFIHSKIKMGEQAFIVVPAISESETLDLQNLEKVFEKFKKIFPQFKITSLHGQMNSEDKEKALKNFKAGSINILVATTVIEVGIDVPNANIIAIFNPERFGLSSLHQLRGRVGRGNKPGYCFLITDSNISIKSLERLKVIENTTDGFQIAEEDLGIRGEGNLFGQEQSGKLPTNKVSHLSIDSTLMEKAALDAQNSWLKVENPEKYFSAFYKSDLVENTI